MGCGASSNQSKSSSNIKNAGEGLAEPTHKASVEEIKPVHDPREYSVPSSRATSSAQSGRSSRVTPLFGKPKAHSLYSKRIPENDLIFIEQRITSAMSGRQGSSSTQQTTLSSGSSEGLSSRPPIAPRRRGVRPPRGQSLPDFFYPGGSPIRSPYSSTPTNKRSQREPLLKEHSFEQETESAVKQIVDHEIIAHRRASSADSAVRFPISPFIPEDQKQEDEYSYLLKKNHNKLFRDLPDEISESSSYVVIHRTVKVAWEGTKPQNQNSKDNQISEDTGSCSTCDVTESYGDLPPQKNNQEIPATSVAEVTKTSVTSVSSEDSDSDTVKEEKTTERSESSDQTNDDSGLAGEKKPNENSESGHQSRPISAIERLKQLRQLTFSNFPFRKLSVETPSPATPPDSGPTVPNMQTRGRKTMKFFRSRTVDFATIRTVEERNKDASSVSPTRRRRIQTPKGLTIWRSKIKRNKPKSSLSDYSVSSSLGFRSDNNHDSKADTPPVPDSRLQSSIEIFSEAESESGVTDFEEAPFFMESAIVHRDFFNDFADIFEDDVQVEKDCVNENLLALSPQKSSKTGPISDLIIPYEMPRYLTC